MGTRADFYVGTTENAEWLGSTAWDGNPDGLGLTLASKKAFSIPGWDAQVVELPDYADFPEGQGLLDSTTEEELIP